MPNFFTHWLVATQAISACPSSIQEGYTQYIQKIDGFTKSLKAILSIKMPDIVYIPATIINDRKERLNKLLHQIDATLATDQNVICFSAYMLGACGPDFWVTMSQPPCHVFPEYAGLHFDLGHYNRTHRQFEVAIQRWKAMQRVSRGLHVDMDFQLNVEQAYFLGMATHIATDLVVHQLVNVHAGAYNLMKGTWKNENGAAPVNLWQMHNKIEHYWDSYIRYCCFGDIPPLFGDIPDLVGEGKFKPFGFPTLEKQGKEALQKIKSENNRHILKTWFGFKSTRYGIERFFNFPRLFADRVVEQDGLVPFMYDVVVNKDHGAYPKAEVFKKATKESKEYMMKMDGEYNERWKLRNFCTEINKGDKTWSNNYLTYFVCPNLAQLKDVGDNNFFNMSDLWPFLKHAVSVSKVFLNDLQNAYNSADAKNMNQLNRFWNLDTGTGLKVQNVKSDCANEVITRINLCHVFDEVKVPDAPLAVADTHLGNRAAGNYKANKGERRFPTVAPSEPFADIWQIQSDENAYLKRIWLENSLPVESSLPTMKDFLAKVKASGQAASKSKKSFSCKSDQCDGKNSCKAISVLHRLSLQFRTAIAPFRDEEELSFYLECDGDTGLWDSEKHKDERTKAWLKGEKNKKHTLLHHFVCRANNRAMDSEEDRIKLWKSAHVFDGNIVRMESDVFCNFEKEKEEKRKYESGQWNNVIEYEKHKTDWGRNWAVEGSNSHNHA